MNIISGIKGTLLIDIYPAPIHLNGNESICFDDDKRSVCFINNVSMINPNNGKEYLCDMIFAGKNMMYADFVLSTEEESYIRVSFYDSDDYGKYIEFVIHEAEEGWI